MRRTYPNYRRKPVKPLPKADGNAFQKILSNSAVIVTIVTALLYFHGRSLYQGYLSYWGLSTDIFPISTEDALFHGVYAYLLLGLEKLKYLLLPLLYTLFLYILLFLFCLNKQFFFIQRLIDSKRFDVFNKRQKELISDFTTGIQKISITILAVFCFLLVTLLSSEKGKSVAEKDHQKVTARNQAPKEFRKTSVFFHDEENRITRITGHHIASSPLFCAIDTREGVQVIPFSRIILIQIPNGGLALPSFSEDSGDSTKLTD